MTLPCPGDFLHTTSNLGFFHPMTLPCPGDLHHISPRVPDHRLTQVSGLRLFPPDDSSLPWGLGLLSPRALIYYRPTTLLPTLHCPADLNHYIHKAFLTDILLHSVQTSHSGLRVGKHTKTKDLKDRQGLISVDRSSKATLPLTTPRPVQVVCKGSSPRNRQVW